VLSPTKAVTLRKVGSRGTAGNRTRREADPKGEADLVGRGGLRRVRWRTACWVTHTSTFGLGLRGQKHFRLLRGAVAASGGTEVKNLGDGLMVMFISPSRALAGAAGMQQAVERHSAGSATASAWSSLADCWF
jgi:hypothetical protein